ncbi:calcium-binding protein [Solirubrobacter soli]|uniref:calcium-binding protein n=1 Tax=Solirubrobacter soli TaxID=363832 RepID=UPI0004115356|nr:calcium-binding protein [Solirubrobacter soli]
MRYLIATVAAFAAIVPAAHAGTLSVSGTTITFQANPGEANFFTVNWGNVSAGPDFVPKFDDHVDITPGPGCVVDGLGGHCDAAGPNPTVIVHLGDGNDLGQSINDHAAGHSVQFYGEDGDDDLQSGGSADLLDGGAGNDRLQPDDDDAGSGDVVVGGPGTDSLWLDYASGGNGPITASLDGLGNDGFAGETDNYAADIENVEGVSTAPSIHFVGTDGPNVVKMRSESADVLIGMGGDDLIDAANGNDVIDGGDGNDTIYGGGNDDQIKGGPGLDSLSGEGSASGFFISVPGSDTIDARDGIREQIDCGQGADTAIVDELDVVPQDPGSLCEAVDRAAAAPASGPPTIRSTKLSVKSGRVSVSLSCAAACSGKLTLRTTKKVTVASGSYSIAAGKSATVRLKLSSKGRSLMRKVTKVRVKLTASPKTGKAVSKTLTLRG